jgi:beta-N-acetylhexosaminidase
MSAETEELKRYVGASLILGFRGSELTDNHPISSAIDEFELGGVILFDQDMVHKKPVHNIKSPEQLRNLCNDLQSQSDYPLIISIDQEGGIVKRLKPEYGFSDTVSHLELGKKDDEQLTCKQGRLIAGMLSGAGINMNFAPVVDLDTNLENPIIHGKERSFSADPDLVTRHAKAYMKGHDELGVLPTLKHFPGHGSSFGDTHLGFTDVTETWHEDELIPYKNLIAEGYDKVIMTTHIYNQHLDPEHPSTLSKKVLTGMLRKDLGFEGLIVSDDMQMGSITDKYGLETAVVLALNAGVNVMCFGNNLSAEPVTADKMYNIVRDALDSGELELTTLKSNYHFIKDFVAKHLTDN